MKRIFLVDTENMAAHWIGLLPNLTRVDKIILMYTKYTPHISFDSFKEALDHSDKVNLIEWISCGCGSENALDFQLASYMGFLMKTNIKTEFYIVSNDTGFDVLVSFWSERERFIKRLGVNQLNAYLSAPIKEKPGEAPNGPGLAKTEQTFDEDEILGDRHEYVLAEKIPTTDEETVMKILNYTKKPSYFPEIMKVLTKHTAIDDAGILMELEKAINPNVALNVYNRLKKYRDEVYH